MYILSFDNYFQIGLNETCKNPISNDDPAYFSIPSIAHHVLNFFVSLPVWQTTKLNICVIHNPTSIYMSHGLLL